MLSIQSGVLDILLFAYLNIYDIALFFLNFYSLNPSELNFVMLKLLTEEIIIFRFVFFFFFMEGLPILGVRETIK
jgi:hypothetical protein